MEEFRIFSVCNTQTICDEIKSGFAQKNIALSYAMAIRSAANKHDDPDWAVINKAIIERWSMGGLERVKKMAHAILAKG